MLPQAQTGSLKNVRNAFSSNGDIDKLNTFISELQGSGSQTINSIVNELVFLRRELNNDYPDESNVRSLLKAIYKQTKRATRGSSKHADILSQLQAAVKEAAQAL